MTETSLYRTNAATTPLTASLALFTAVLVALDGPTFAAFAARSTMPLELATAAAYAGILIGVIAGELSTTRIDWLVVIGLSVYLIAGLALLTDSAFVVTAARLSQGIGLGITALASIEILNLPAAKRAARLKIRSSLIALLAVAGPIFVSAMANANSGSWWTGPMTLTTLTLVGVAAWLIANKRENLLYRNISIPGRARRKIASPRSITLGLSAFIGSAIPSFLLIGALTDSLPLNSHLWMLAAACLVPTIGIISALVSKSIHLDTLPLSKQLKITRAGWIFAFVCLLLSANPAFPVTILVVTASSIIGFCSYIHVTGILVYLVPDSNQTYSLLAKQLGTHSGNLAGVTAAAVLIPLVGYFFALASIGSITTIVLYFQYANQRLSNS